MGSWCVDVKCKEKFRDPKSMASILFPMLDDFHHTSDKEYIENIEDFMAKFAANYVVLNVDLDQELLLLVKVADENIKQKPFLYQAQRLSAVQLLCIPFNELGKVEKIISPKVAHVKTILIYNTGRCGSTILCKALDQLPTVQSISEPDVYTVLSLQYDNKTPIFPNAQLSRKTLVSVTRVATLLLNYYFISCDPVKINICYKHRSQAIDGAELLQQALPNAKNIYMYRSCLAFTESYVRLMTGSSYSLYWLLSTLRLDVLFLWSRMKSSWVYQYIGNAPEYEKVPFRHGFYWCFGYTWWANVQKALKLTQVTPRFFSAVLKYEDLVERKEELVFQVAEAVSLLEDVKSRSKNELYSTIASVFKSNSQTGSAMASQRNQDTEDVWFGECEKRDINEVLQYLGHGVQDADFTLTDTVTGVSSQN